MRGLVLYDWEIDLLRDMDIARVRKMTGSSTPGAEVNVVRSHPITPAMFDRMFSAKGLK